MNPSRVMVDIFLGVCVVLMLANFFAPWMGLERIDQLSWLAPGLAGLLLGVRPRSRNGNRADREVE